MVLFTTLKANKENGIDEIDIAIAYDETYGVVGNIFGEDYTDKWGETDFDKLLEDYKPRQIASACLKQLKQDAKNGELEILNWTTHKVFIDIDAPEIAFMQMEELVKMGLITGSSDLKELDRLARKKGCRIKKEVCYDEVNRYYRMIDIDDYIEENYPCNYDIEGECNNCGNCH